MSMKFNSEKKKENISFFNLYEIEHLFITQQLKHEILTNLALICNNLNNWILKII